MVTRVVPASPRTLSSGVTSTYERVWHLVAVAAAMVSVAVAVMQSQRLALLGLSLTLGALGGLLSATRASRGGAGAGRRFVDGALAAGGLALVAVGVGHHPDVGLTMIAILTGSSPWTLRWMAHGRVGS